MYAAVLESILVSGKAIIINVVSVAAGFLVLVFSDMVPLQYFGLLITWLINTKLIYRNIISGKVHKYRCSYIRVRK